MGCLFIPIPFREQKRHIKLLHIKLCPVTSVTGLPGRVPPGQKDLCSLRSEDRTEIFDPWTPDRETPSTGRSPAKKIYVYVLFLSWPLRHEIPTGHRTEEKNVHYHHRKKIKKILCGAKLYTPTPPHPWNTLLGWGAYQKGGRIKILPREGGLNIYTPPLSPLKMPCVTWTQLGPFLVPACPPLTAINGY